MTMTAPASRTCLECGQLIPERREWHGLKIENGPVAIYWRGVRQATLPAAMHKALWLLVLKQGGVVSRFALELLSGMDVADAANIARVQIYHLRHWLRQNDIPFAIETVRGEGYRLVLAA